MKRVVPMLSLFLFAAVGCGGEAANPKARQQGTHLYVISTETGELILHSTVAKFMQTAQVSEYMNWVDTAGNQWFFECSQALILRAETALPGASARWELDPPKEHVALGAQQGANTGLAGDEHTQPRYETKSDTR